MALKVVPAGDERCDIHNGRKPATYICKSCLEDLGIESGPGVPVSRGPIRRLRRVLRRSPFRQLRRVTRRSGLGSRRRLLIGAGVGLLVGVVVVIAVLIAGGGGGATESGPPTEAEVVDALGLSPNPSGSGWITLDGDCAVLSIRVGTTPTTQPVSPETIATNEGGNVRAVVVNAFSQSQAACVDRISAELRDHF